MLKLRVFCASSLVCVLVACQPRIETSPTSQELQPTLGASNHPTETATEVSLVSETREATPATTAAMGLRLTLADPAWDGERIPDGQQCLRFGGDSPSTPRIRVGNLPAETDALILEFSDRDYTPMDDGGHGKLGYQISQASDEVLVPAVPGHTFDLPEGFFIVQAHQAPTFDTAGAYMPPCSGGTNHAYYVTVKAVQVVSVDDSVFNVLDMGTLELGNY